MIKILVILIFCLIAAATSIKRYGHEYGNYFEGDMILNEEQLMAILSPISARNGLIQSEYRWPNKTVLYAFSPSHTREQNYLIEHALKTLESVSCVKFLRRSNEPHYVQLTAWNRGCYSSVGYQGNVQALNLQGKDCFRIATIMHEFLHALGFYHMQSAYDRDQYITVHWENIRPGDEYNFGKYQNSMITHFNTTYDYYSVMHYGRFGFSKNGRPTIVSNDPAMTKVIGQRLGLSRTDILKLNRMYECDQDTATHQTS